MNPVRELLRAGGEGLAELWLAEGAERARSFAELEKQGRAAGAKVRVAPRVKLDKLAGTGNHQGVVAVVADYRYRSLDDLFDAAKAAGRPPLLVVLDGIEDPQNLGAIIRSAYALGAHGVVIAKDRAVGVTGSAAKASAGAVEHCPVARVTNIAQTIRDLKEEGVWSVGAVAEGDGEISELDLTGPTALVIGSEGEGIRPLVRKCCDHLARIPMAGKLGSLNASAAAAICLYEAARQRNSPA
jgi:23S rRNA (guanosine2251-2'-O)-methyltransferase